jgi:hypothetical protein
VEEKDYLVADVHVKDGDTVVAHQHDAQIVVRPGRLAGIQVDDLADKLKGLKAGEKREFKLTVPDTHPNEQMKGKEVTVEVAPKDIKRLEPAEINQEFLEGLGFQNEAELNDALRQQMVERIGLRRAAVDARAGQQVPARQRPDRAADEAVGPPGRSRRQAPRDGPDDARHAARAVEANLEKLSGGAKDEAIRELKLFFILQKIADRPERRRGRGGAERPHRHARRPARPAPGKDEAGDEQGRARSPTCTSSSRAEGRRQDPRDGRSRGSGREGPAAFGEKKD